MTDQFVAEIRLFPFNFAPIGWAACDGQLLPISQNTALFSLVGTFYGGDGRSNFGLPNLQGNVPMDSGSGIGLTPRVLGETGGEESVTLLQTEMPGHQHRFVADTTVGTTTNPANNLLGEAAINPREPRQIYADGAVNTQMLAGNLLATGGGQPHNNLQPYLTLNFCIAMQGTFPARG
jgi:microcystin-dependent protein